MYKELVAREKNRNILSELLIIISITTKNQFLKSINSNIQSYLLYEIHGPKNKTETLV